MQATHTSSLFMQNRSCGVLMDISSLPSLHGIGDLGVNSFKFIDWLNQCRVNFWEILALTSSTQEMSLYLLNSVFAGNPLLISLEVLKEQGFLKDEEIINYPVFIDESIDFEKVKAYKNPLLHIAAKRFIQNKSSQQKELFEKFCENNGHWIIDYALFVILKNKFNNLVWWDWDKIYRDRDLKTMKNLKKEYAEQIMQEMVIQFFFEQQIFQLKEYCNNKNVKIIADISIHIEADTADVWANQEIFKLNLDKKPIFYAGFSPDILNPSGIILQNRVVFDWKHLATKGYAWWIQRFSRYLNLVHIVKIINFKAFYSYLEVTNNKLDFFVPNVVYGPSYDFFKLLKKSFNNLPFIVDDLVVNDVEVLKLRDEFNLPGILILQHAFGNDAYSFYLPHNHEKNRVIYTGFYNNEMSIGWWKIMPENTKIHICDYLGCINSEYEFAISFIKLALSSVANIAILTMQDILLLDNETCVMNINNIQNNCTWKLKSFAQLNEHITYNLSKLINLYGRNNS